MNTNDLWQQAMQLPEPDRAALAHQLLLSLEPDDFDADTEAAWAVELEARLAAVEQGRFAARDWREALADIRQALREKS
jgi:putative addiction module component (TIGR02574 family)